MIWDNIIQFPIYFYSIIYFLKKDKILSLNVFKNYRRIKYLLEPKNPGICCVLYLSCIFIKKGKMIQQKNLQKKKKKKTLTTLIQFKKLSYLYHRFLSSSSMLINRHTGILIFFTSRKWQQKLCKYVRRRCTKNTPWLVILFSILLQNTRRSMRRRKSERKKLYNELMLEFY